MFFSISIENIALSHRTDFASSIGTYNWAILSCTDRKKSSYCIRTSCLQTKLFKDTVFHEAAILKVSNNYQENIPGGVAG